MKKGKKVLNKMQGIIIYKQLFEIMEEITFEIQIVKCM